MKLKELAERVHGRLHGDGDLEISRVNGIEQAGPGELSFIANPKYHGFLNTTRASAVLVAPGTTAPATGPVIIECDHPYLAFAQALGLLLEATLPVPGVDSTSVVASDAVLGEQVSIGALVVVGAAARVGARTIVFPGSVIGPGAVIGDDCVIHARVSIRERIHQA